MKLRILARYPGYRGFWTDGQHLLAGRGYRLYTIAPPDAPRCIGALSGMGWRALAARVRLICHGLRLGLHNAWPTADNGVVAVARKQLLRLDSQHHVLQRTAPLRIGNKPGSKGICVTPADTIYYGEYSLNPERTQPSGVFSSTDHGRTYQQLYEFPPGRIRHIHFIQWDAYENCLWMGTGDHDSECMILRSPDGTRWDIVGQGSQLWRSVGLAFRPEAVYWGNDAGGPDAGTEPACIVRLDRRTGALQRVHELQGPCHGTCVLADATLVISTGCEGGHNERDNRAHLWASRDGQSWHELASWRKDPWPYIAQFGVIHFPHGQERGNNLCFTTFGLAGAAQCLHVAALED